ncbi:F-box domain, cyclin-like domain containing protein [Rhodotorula toruloides]|uniref:F-box domain, cyclin-like domain containing protein n=1 Tax=Rhodotorula toruloides TaxID=5286 RepID=A0A511KR12_RHOTO|nr:F-box domain, cyclin-like domain containing protein [Rhodotorula toruloides]
MSARTRLPRRAAQVAKYTFDEPSDDEPEGPRTSDEDKKRKKGKARAAGKKSRLVAHSDEEEEGQVSTTKHIRVPSPSPEDVDYEVKRVDFSNVLPLETIAEVFSYLTPETLYSLAFLNRTFHTVIASASFRSTWRDIFTWHHSRYNWIDVVWDDYDDYDATRSQGTKEENGKKRQTKREKLPQLNGEDIDPYRLAILLYEKTCEYCGKDKVVQSDPLLLLRLCDGCRRNNLVPLDELRRNNKYDGMHPAITHAVLTTTHPSKSGREEQFIITHLYDTAATLDDLQFEDDAENRVRGADLDARAVTRELKRAAKLKSSWRTYRKEVGEKIEREVLEQFGPHVSAFVKDRAKEKKERLEHSLTVTQKRVERFHGIEIAEGAAASAKAKGERHTSIRQHIECGGIFESEQIDDNRLSRHPAVNKAEPLADGIWDSISNSVYAHIGRGVAKQLVWKYEGRRKAVDWHAAKTSVDLLKQPPSVSDAGEGASFTVRDVRLTLYLAGWTYVEAAMKQLIQAKEDESKRIVAHQRDVQDLACQQKIEDNRNAFFRERYDKICRMLPTDEARAYMPRFLDFLRLPTVNELYAEKDYGTDTKRAELDVERFTTHLEAVKAEIDDFAIDLRLQALKVILASTTEMTSDEVDELDTEALADPHYGDDFFLKPSSWVFCADCTTFGPLVDVLAHTHQQHPRSPAPLQLKSAEEGGKGEKGEKDEKTAPQQDAKPPARLPLEVACTWSAVCEGHKLLWENGPHGYRSRSEWRQLLSNVLSAAAQAQRSGDVLEPPLIALKDLTLRERRRVAWTAARMLAAANFARTAQQIQERTARSKRVVDSDEEGQDDSDEEQMDGGNVKKVGSEEGEEEKEEKDDDEDEHEDEHEDE